SQGGNRRSHGLPSRRRVDPHAPQLLPPSRLPFGPPDRLDRTPSFPPAVSRVHMHNCKSSQKGDPTQLVGTDTAFPHRTPARAPKHIPTQAKRLSRTCCSAPES